MKDETYIDRLNEIKAQVAKDIDQLNLQFVKEAARFEIGNIIKDKAGRIVEISKILYRSPDSYYNNTDYPLTSYHGKQLTKQLTPRKDLSTMNLVDTPFEELTLVRKS